jgi:Fe-S-cluster-containing dehydrogenase component
VGIYEKCVFCYERVEQGLTTMCSASCPTKARIFGDLDDPQSEINAYIQQSGATNMPGTSIYYVKGDHRLDLAGILMTSGTETEEPAGMKKAESATVDPLLVGSGVVVAAAAVGAGVAYKKSRDKKKADLQKGGEKK